eukprot:9920812-Alexandrium_andersonii.AAC.1
MPPTNASTARKGQCDACTMLRAHLAADAYTGRSRGILSWRLPSQAKGQGPEPYTEPASPRVPAGQEHLELML